MNTVDERIIQEIVHQCLAASRRPVDLVATLSPGDLRIITGVSNRHVHLCREDLTELFGEGYELTPLKELSQPGFFSARETLIVGGPKGALTGIRILGPLRKTTQIEISLSDGRYLGVVPPVRQSGEVGPSPALTLIGPRGTVVNNTGVIAAWRHIHMDEAQAGRLDIRNGEMVSVRTSGSRALVLDNVVVRTAKDMATQLHIDTDEGNSANIQTGDIVEIVRAHTIR